MKMFKLTKSFAKDETGAVTVDWVVLAGAVVAVAVGVVALLETGLNTAASNIGDTLTGISTSSTGSNTADS